MCKMHAYDFSAMSGYSVLKDWGMHVFDWKKLFLNHLDLKHTSIFKIFTLKVP